MKIKKRSKKKTIGVMTQDRGFMPPPTVKDVVKKKKNNRKQVKQDIRKGECYYEVC